MTLVSNSNADSGESQPLLSSSVAIEVDDGNDNSAIIDNILHRNNDDCATTNNTATTTTFVGEKRRIVLSALVVTLCTVVGSMVTMMALKSGGALTAYHSSNYYSSYYASTGGHQQQHSADDTPELAAAGTIENIAVVSVSVSSSSSSSVTATTTLDSSDNISTTTTSMKAVPITEAKESMLDIGNGLSMWYRVWGTPPAQGGIPVLFVHGGPGNAVSDYGNGNADFFDYTKYYVIEADQRGTGKSQPSVRENCANIHYYVDISIEKMSNDYEVLRHALQIDKWLVFGGSWGSTLSIDYAERYPQRCLGVILRGIFLNTLPEMVSVYSRDSYLHNAGQLEEFDTYFGLAEQYVRDNDDAAPRLNPNEPQPFIRTYERMIGQCTSDDPQQQEISQRARWYWHVFENNLMEIDNPDNLLDQHHINVTVLPEATSVSFFEARLFLNGVFENPSNLLGKVPQLQAITTMGSPGTTGTTQNNTAVWVCQGIHDLVCPDKYAHELVDALDKANVKTVSHFVNSGHLVSYPEMFKCLKNAIDDFTINNYYK